MKKLTIALAVLLAGYAANSLAALPTGVCSRCDVNVPSYCGGFTFGLAGLYWRPSSPQLDYAVTFPPGTNIFGTAFSTTGGHHHNVDHDYDWGFKASIGYVFPCSGNDINLTYTHWDNDDHDGTRNFGGLIPTLSAPFFADGVLPAPLIFSSPVTLFGGAFAIVTAALPITFSTVLDGVIVPVDPADITGISARSNFENHTWDLDFGQTINVGCNFRLRWFGGIRYSRLEHDLDVRTDALVNETGLTVLPETDVPFLVSPVGSTVPSIPTTGVIEPIVDVTFALRDFVSVSSEFDGVGPRFGFDASYHLGGGFGVVGSLSTSLLVGETKNTYNERIEGTGTVAITGADILIDPTVVTGVTPSLIIGATVTSAIPPLGTPIPVVFDPLFSTISFQHPDETRVVPNIDAKLGLDWTYQFCNCSRSKVTVEAGYLVSHYFNAIDRVSALDAIAPEVRSRETLDISFDGPYIGVQVNL